MHNDTLTTQEAAKRLHKGVRTIRRYLACGRFPNATKGKNGRVAIPITDIIRYETGQTPQQQVTPDVLEGDTFGAGRDDTTPSPHHETPVIAENGSDDVTMTNALEKTDVRFLLKIDVTWFQFLYVRKAGDPSLIRDVLASMRAGLRRLFHRGHK